MTTVCLISVSRADYGLLRWVAKEISASPLLDLQLLTAGTHFSEGFGQTGQEIGEEHFKVDYSIPIEPDETTPRGVLNALGGALFLFAEAYDKLQPDIILLLGDRSETVLAGYAATIYGIPIAHIHGGEITAGAIDDVFRHAITKMAHLHFVAHADYGRRVVQLGEKPETVHVTGPLGHESVQRVEFLPQQILEEDLKVPLSGNNFLITLHPETLHPERTKILIEETLAALAELVDCTLIFTAANQDVGGYEVNEVIRAFCSRHPQSSFVESLGTRRYLSLISRCQAVIGNSSSGIFEAPALGVPTINIGKRQDGRIRVPSIIDVPADRKAVLNAIKEVLSGVTSKNLEMAPKDIRQRFPSEIIAQVLESSEPNSLRDKTFFDLPSRLDAN